MEAGGFEPGGIEWARDPAHVPATAAEAAQAFDPTRVDPARLHGDVMGLIFGDCRNTTTWDHLGNSDPVVAPDPRRVHLDAAAAPEELEPPPPSAFVDLPSGLSCLFDVISEESFLAEMEARRILEGAAEPAAAAVAEASSEKAKPTETEQSGTNEEGKEEKDRERAEQPADGPPAEAARDPQEIIRLRGPPVALPYLLTLAALPAEAPDRCVHLYDVAMARYARIKAEDDARKRAAEEAEERECTFKPKISKTSVECRPRHADFHAATVEWQKHRDKKLEKKREKEQREFDEDNCQAWAMSKRSVRLAERFKQKQREAGLPVSLAKRSVSRPAAPPAAGPQRGASEASVPKRRGYDDEFFAAAYAPATNVGAAERAVHEQSVLRGASVATSDPQVLEGAFAAAADGTPDEKVRGASVPTAASGASPSFAAPSEHGSSATAHARLQEAQTSVLFADNPSATASVPRGQSVAKRLQADVEGRRQRQADRVVEYHERQREKLYDKITGQPLFEPNGLPSIVRPDGLRVMWDRMSEGERAGLLKKIASHKLDVSQALRAWSDAQSGPPPAAPTTVGTVGCRRDAEEVVADLMRRGEESMKRLKKLRREDDRELSRLFRPQVNTSGAGSVVGRAPIHELPLPQGQKKVDADRAAPKPKIAGAAAGTKRSDDAAMQRLMERSKEHQEKRARAMRLKAKEIEREHTQQCTFSPAVSRGSRVFMKRAEQRLAAETSAMGGYRSYSDVFRPQPEDDPYGHSTAGSEASHPQAFGAHPHPHGPVEYASHHPDVARSLERQRAHPAPDFSARGYHPVDPYRRAAQHGDDIDDIADAVEDAAASEVGSEESVPPEALVDEVLADLGISPAAAAPPRFAAPLGSWGEHSFASPAPAVPHASAVHLPPSEPVGQPDDLAELDDILAGWKELSAVRA